MKFNTKKTGMPLYDNILENLEYFEENKNKTYKIVHMKPAIYISICANKFGNDLRMLRESRQDNLKYNVGILEVEKWNMPMLDFTNGFCQEGITRSLRAEKEGLKEIPVMIIFKKNPHEKAWH